MDNNNNDKIQAKLEKKSLSAFFCRVERTGGGEVPTLSTYWCLRW